MDDALKETLLEQFRAYLEDVQRGAEPAPEAREGEDQFSLVAELAALKSEIKRESRQVKEALDEFRSVFGTLQAGYETLTRELEQRQVEEKRLRRELLRPLLLQLLDLHDRVEAGVKLELAPPRRSFLGRLVREDTQLLDSMREGQAITLRRLNRLLADHQLRPLEALGNSLDPHTMRVVEVESRADVAEGIVTGELRKGFFWGDELLRLAEVKVNKRKETA